MTSLRSLLTPRRLMMASIGVAIATITAQIFSWIFGILYLNKKYPALTIRPFVFKFDKHIYYQIIRLGLPVNFKTGIAGWAADAGLNDAISGNMQALVDALAGKREIGPAIFRSMIDYIQAKKAFDADDKSSYAEALSIFIVPQLQGVEDEVAQIIYQTAGLYLEQTQRQIIRDSIYGATGYQPV